MNRNKNAKNPSRKRGNQKQNTRQKPNRVNTNRGRGPQSLSLNSMQMTDIKVNRFWEITRASTPGGMRIRAREPLGALTATSTSASFQPVNINGASPFFINPTQFTSRIAQIANAYEFFIFNRFRVELIPNQPTTATGQMAMAIYYASGEDTSAPVSITDMLSSISSTVANVYSVSSIELIKSLCRAPKYICSSSALVTFYLQVSQGNLVAATSGFAASAIGAALGELMVDYDIEFFTPMLSSAIGLSSANMKLVCSEIDKIRRICDCEENVPHFKRLDELTGHKHVEAILPVVTETICLDCDSFEEKSQASDKTPEAPLKGTASKLLQPSDKILKRVHSAKD